MKEEALRKELHTTRLALIKQLCNNHNADTDRIDDIVSIYIFPCHLLNIFIVVV